MIKKQSIFFYACLFKSYIRNYIYNYWFDFLEPITKMLGANESMLNDYLNYGRVLLFGLVPFILQNSFQSFIVVGEKPHFGLMIQIWF